MSVKFSAGRYYIGDLCYVIKEDNWDELLKQSGCLGLDFKSDQWFGIFKDFKLYAGGTAHGDGVYRDNKGNEYAVDSGTLGIISADWLDDENDANELGNIIEFAEDFEVSMHNGVFEFGNIIIDTEWDGDEDEEDELCFDCGENLWDCRCGDEDVCHGCGEDPYYCTC